MGLRILGHLGARDGDAPVAMGRLLRGRALVHIEGTDEGLQGIHDGLALCRASGVRMEDLCFDRAFPYVPELHRLEGELRARAGAPGVVECMDRAAAGAREREADEPPSALPR